MIWVTPLAGVWIEIKSKIAQKNTKVVTPLAGVWIEMIASFIQHESNIVTPLAGVWIEILYDTFLLYDDTRHSPCGSVD